MIKFLKVFFRKFEDYVLAICEAILTCGSVAQWECIKKPLEPVPLRDPPFLRLVMGHIPWHFAGLHRSHPGPGLNIVYTVPKVMDFPRYNTKCSGENKIQGAIFRVVYRFPLHFVLYLGLLFRQSKGRKTTQQRISLKKLLSRELFSF